MDSFGLEVTAHRIAGADGPREFGPWFQQIVPDLPQRFSLHAREFHNTWIDLEFEPWRLVREGLLSTSLRVLTADGFQVCNSRAVLLSTLPSDVPLYSNHIGSDSRWGVVSVGLRTPRSSWEPKDIEE